MKDIINVLKRNGTSVGVVYHTGQFEGSGKVQSIRGGYVSVDDMNGGAFRFPLCDVSSVNVNSSTAFITIVDWQK